MPDCNKGLIKSAHGWINWKVLCVDKCLLWQRGRGAGPPVLQANVTISWDEWPKRIEQQCTTFSFCYLRSVFCCSCFTAVLQTKCSSEQFIIEPTQQICKNIWYISKNSNLQLIQYKILHRVHCTAQKMPKMGLLRCEICTHTYLHALWLCTLVQQFSLQVTRSLFTMIACLIPLPACLCLLGDTTTITDDVHNPKLLLIALTIGKETILVNWKTRTTISLTQSTVHIL